MTQETLDKLLDCAFKYRCEKRIFLSSGIGALGLDFKGYEVEMSERLKGICFIGVQHPFTNQDMNAEVMLSALDAISGINPEGYGMVIDMAGDYSYMDSNNNFLGKIIN